MHKRSGPRAALRGKRVALAVTAAFLPWGEAYSLPTGEQVVHGQVSVSRPDAQRMQIDQASHKGIVNWQGFSIGATEHVNITQPSASASLLNRVVGNNPSEIFGRLTANGQVFLVNNAGVLFAPGASVSAASIVASTLSITDQNFINGNYQFYNPGGAGSVVNQGSIVTAGGYTALIGPQVRNDGVIIANSGKVALGAGDRVSLDMIGDGLVSISVEQAAFNASVVNTGTIQADGGTVLLKASSANALLDTVINAGGVIRANSLVARNGEIFLDGGGAGVVAVSGTVQAAGGTVTVSGDKVALHDGARVDVSGDAGGGAVSTHANALWMGSGSAVNADALQSGDGGRVVLWAADSTQVHGTVTARGAGDGSGGFVETSGAYLEVSRAPQVGPGGTWLIDPFNILVVAGAGLVNNAGAISFTPNGDDSQIGADLIVGQLNAGTNVTLDTGVAGTQEGDVTFNAAVFKGALNASTLTVNAADDVVINAAINMSSGNFNVTAGGDMVVTSSATTSGGSMNITLGGDLSVLGNATSASLTAQTGQTITARSVEVTAQANGSANITNGAFGMVTPGNQVITITGGAPNTGLAVQTRAGGASAFVTNFASTEQHIVATNADHVSVVGHAGAAGIQANAGNQTISITGSGANAISIGSATATGQSTVNGFNQTITAGNANESGSITITGSNGSGGATHFANIGVGVANPQTVRTSGTLSVTGGTATQSRGAAGIFQNNPAEQRISAANVVLQGSSTGPGNGAFINSTFGGGQVFQVPGELRVSGGAGGAAGIFNGTNTPLPGTNTPNTNSAPQTINAGSVIVQGGGGGSGNGAFINSQFGGNQTLTVPGELRITGGAGGTGNRAGIITNANQTINGNPHIVLRGGDGGGEGNASNNVFIQATGDDTKVQTINARSVEIRSGAGTDASATFNAARQVITTTGDVSLFGGAGSGPVNGVRIGGVGGTTLGPTNLTLNVGGNLLLRGGTANGAGLGSSGASTQANTITVTAGNIALESEGAGARIGANATASPVNPGTITVTAGGDLNVASGTGIRANGPITLTANSLTNDGAISNGGGASTANMILNADRFDIDGGNIQGGNAAVILRPRTGTNSFGVQASGDTTLTNADLAKINTTNFVVLGSGMGETFTGTMTIGETAPVQGAGKSLAFFRSNNPGGDIVVGTHGVTTTGDVIIGAGGGAIRSSGGTVAGDEAILRASQGIGAAGNPVETAVSALAISNTGGAGVFVREAGDVTLRSVALNVGGIMNNQSTTTGNTALDLTTGGALNVAGQVFTGPLTINAGGGLNVAGAGAQDAFISSVGGQAITAQSLNVSAQDGRLAHIANSGSGSQAITTGALSVGGGSALANATLSGVIQNAGDAQTINASSVLVQGTDAGANNGIFIRAASGDQSLTVNGDITIAAGAGGEAWIQGSPNGRQTIHARDITMTNGVGGNNSFAALQAGHQEIHASGDVRLTGGATGSTNGGVRMGGLRNATVVTATDLRLFVGGDLVLTGGSAPNNFAGIGSTGAFGVANDIYIEAGSVILNPGVGTGARIGHGTTPGGGTIEIHAVRGIELNGTTPQSATTIRSLGNVALDAASISQAASGFIAANTLTTTTSGNASLTGPNRVASFSGTSSGDVNLANTGALNVTGLSASNAALTNAGDVTVSGTWNSSTASITTTGAGSDLTVNGAVTSSGAMNVNVAGDIAVTAGAGQDAMLRSFGGQAISARSLAVTSNGGFARVWNSGPSLQTINVSGGAGVDVQTLAAGGFAQISADAGGNQTINAVNADHISVNGAMGGASIFNFGGTQTLSITGSGANAITIGRSGSLGPSTISGGVQSITAGASGQSGSISIVGADANATFTGISSGQIIGGTQTVSTSGTLRISGGSAPNQPPFGFATGLFHNGSGEQRVSAGNIEMRGGPSGANNVAIIISSGGAGTIAAGDQVINAGGGNIELTGGLSGTNNTAIIVSSAHQTVSAGNVRLQAGASGSTNGAFINSTFGRGQLFNVSGELSATGGAGGGVGINNGSNSPLTTNAPQTINAGSIVLQGGPGGTRNGAFILSEFGGDQTLTVPGEIRITGGSGGTRNRAGIVTTANQTINGNPNIFLTGGAGGGAGDASNNVFIQATGDDTKLQRINAGSVEIRSGAGTDASATFNAARQVITTTGDVSLYGGGGAGPVNGVRIGGIGGTTLGPTNLTLNVGGNLLLHGGTVNGASLGSSGASTQSNTITVTAGNNITLESEGGGARIGANASANPVNPGTITLTAGGNLSVGSGTGIRATGPITITAGSLTNDGAISNGGGASTANMILNANAFDLDGGNIQGGNAAVFLRPRDGARSFGIEAAGDTTLTNADLAKINTTNFIGLGSAMGTTFTGSMTIGHNAQVDGGNKNLAFFRSLTAPGTTNVGARGVSTTGDVIVSAGGGAIVSNGGIVAGDEVQLRAGQGIGASGAPVYTAANALTVGTSADAFVSEANDVTLRTIVLNVGGNTILNTTNTSTGGVLDLTVGGALNIAGPVNSTAATISADSIATAGGGSIHATNLTTNSTGSTSLTGPNQVVVYNGTSGADLTFNNTAALHITGINATAGTATLTADGAMTVSGPVVANGVVLTANGVLDEVGGGAIVADSLTTFSTGDTSLNGANQVAVFNATSTGGDVSLANTGALDVTGMGAFGDATITNLGTVTVSGPWTAGGTSTITVGSDILLRSAMQSHDVVLVSTTGAIEQDQGASITAQTLTTSSLTDTVLAGTNVVETINVSSAEGDISLTTASAVLKLSDVNLPGALLVNNTGAVEVTGHVSALSHDIRATGDVTVGGASANAATLLYAPGFITIATAPTKSIFVRGSDTTAGAGSAVIAGGTLQFSAGDVSILGGGALATPAIVRGSAVDMAVERLNVTGGHGHLSPAWLLSGSNINLTVGDAVRLQTGSGLHSWAKVQTETRDGEIRMTFPSRSEGGYFVNGIEGRTNHGQTGFFTLNKPGTLLLEYGAD